MLSRGSRGRAVNFNTKTLTQNFNERVDANAEAEADANTNAGADTDTDTWARTIPLTSTLLRQGNNDDDIVNRKSRTCLLDKLH